LKNEIRTERVVEEHRRRQLELQGSEAEQVEVLRQVQDDRHYHRKH
jgi:hypothetical protein